MAPNEGNDGMLVSAPDGAGSVGGTHGENHRERFEDLESSAAKSSGAGTKRSRASKALRRHSVLSMLLTI